MAFFTPALDIALISSILAILTKVIQWKFVDMNKVKANQKILKEKQAKMRELANKEDKKSQQEFERLNAEVMQTLQETMMASFKQVAISLPIFLGAFWVMGNNYNTDVFSLPTALPWWNAQGLVFLDATNWFGWYFLSYLIATIVINLVLKVREHLRGRM